MKSIKINGIFNVIRTGAPIFFALLSFPYLSRIFGPAGLGNLTFASSFIGYFSLVASLGIPIYGIREVSRVKGSKDELVKLVRELLIIHLIISLFVLSLLIVLIYKVGFFQNERLLYFIYALTLVSSSLTLDWVFQGLEDYKYLTRRTVFIGVFSIVSIFLIIKNNSQLIDYSIILVLTTFLVAFSNLFFLRHIIFDDKFSDLNLKRHLKPLWSSFLLSLLVNIYVQLDIVILRVLSDSFSVGLYAAALKINKISLTLILSFSAVLIPRLSFYVSQKNEINFDATIKNSFSFILLSTLPLVTLMCLMSEEIITLVAGENYLLGSWALVLTSPIILIIGITNILGMQIMYPLGLESKVSLSVFFGALSFVLLSLFLIPKYSYNGAAISSLVSEIVVLLVQCYFLPKKYFQIISMKQFTIPLISCIVMVMSIFFLEEFGGILKNIFLLKMALCCSTYVFSLFLFKEKYTMSLFFFLKNKLRWIKI